MQDAWEAAFALMADHGQLGACQVVARGMEQSPRDRPDQAAGWDAIADCLNAVAAAHGTMH